MLLPNLRFRVPHRFGSARCRAGTGGAKPRPSRAEQENPAVKIGREKPSETPCGRAEQHPAPGWRESGWRGVETGGKVYGVGNNGFSWSTTQVSDSNNAYRSDFNPTWLNPQGNHYRAYAYQLRCLQEEGVKTVPKKTPAFKCRAARPRAAADTAPVCCTASATPGTSGRRRFRRGVAMPTTWTSAPPGSNRRATITVRSVFRCVASRNRERTLGTPTAPVRVFCWACLSQIQPGLTGEKSEPGLPAKKIRKGSEADEMRIEQNER